MLGLKGKTWDHHVDHMDNYDNENIMLEFGRIIHSLRNLECMNYGEELIVPSWKFIAVPLQEEIWPITENPVPVVIFLSQDALEYWKGIEIA